MLRHGVSERRLHRQDRLGVCGQADRGNNDAQTRVFAGRLVVDGAHGLVPRGVDHVLGVGGVEDLLLGSELPVDVPEEVALGLAVQAGARFVEQDHDSLIGVAVGAERGEEGEEPLEAGGAGGEVGLHATVPVVAQLDLEKPVMVLRLAVGVQGHGDQVGVEDDGEGVVLPSSTRRPGRSGPGWRPGVRPCGCRNPRPGSPPAPRRQGGAGTSWSRLRASTAGPSRVQRARGGRTRRGAVRSWRSRRTGGAARSAARAARRRGSLRRTACAGPARPGPSRSP